MEFLRYFGGWGFTFNYYSTLLVGLGTNEKLEDPLGQ